MNSELQHKVAIVTGGAGGHWHAHLEDVCGGRRTRRGASRNQERLDAVVSEIVAQGGEALAVATDITVPEQVDALIGRTVKQFGRLDVMVNNAGGGSRMRPPEDTPIDEWNRLIEFNLTARSCAASPPANA